MFINCKTNLGVAPTQKENNIKTIYIYLKILFIYRNSQKLYDEFATVLLSDKKKNKKVEN
jgi:hypothetical protein